MIICGYRDKNEVSTRFLKIKYVNLYNLKYMILEHTYKKYTCYIIFRDKYHLCVELSAVE